MSDGRAGARGRARAPGARLDLDGGGPAGQLSLDDLGTPLEEVTFVVVDLETTGAKPGPESITEIGAVKVRGGETLGEFSTLVNPGQPIPAFITSLTGITTAMTARAPRIAAVIPSLIEFLGAGPSTVVAAHNARFDVGHLKAAFAGADFAWPSVRVLDTVALAQRAFSSDEVANFKLSTLAGACGATTAPSHRALDDARATVDVLHAMLGRLGPLGVTHLEDLATATDPVPRARRRKARLADGIARSPGVYRFIGPAGDVLYVGSSSNLRARVRQYFTAAETRKRMAEMADLAERAEVDETPTVLEARILELRQIAEFDPPYNRRSRRPDNRPWLALTDEAHPRLKVTASLALEDAAAALGPFGSRKAARQAAELVADDARLRTCTARLPAKPSGRKAPCHLHAMGRCSAPCALPGDPDAPSLAAASSILGGDLDGLWERSMQRLASLAAAERFEQAAVERDRLRCVIDAARRRERILPLLAARQIVGARRDDDGSWDVAVIRWGRLAATGRCPGNADPRELAAELVASASQTDRPAAPGDVASVEETELLAAWLWKPTVRLLSFEGEEPLALPRASAFRFSLPGPDAD